MKYELIHGLLTPNEAFFHWTQNFWAWADKLGRQIGQVNSGAFGVFSAKLSVVSPLSMFLIIQPLFLQKLRLYIHIPNIYLGLGFDFGPQKIRDLAFVYP